MRINFSLVLLIIFNMYALPTIIEKEYNSEKLYRIYDYDDIEDYAKKRIPDSVNVDTISTKFYALDSLLQFVKFEDYNGKDDSKTITLKDYKQLLYQLEKSEIINSLFPDSISPYSNFIKKINTITDDTNQKFASEFGIQMEIGFWKILGSFKIFCCLPLKEATYRGSNVKFNFNNFTTNEITLNRILSITVDFGDGEGERLLPIDSFSSFNIDIPVNYATIGEKSIKTKIVYLEKYGDFDIPKEYISLSKIQIESLSIPDPNYILPLKSEVLFTNYTGKGYVYLSPLNAEITNPIIFVEGFDIDNNWNADEIYNLLRSQCLDDTIKNYGYDIVILNFSSSLIGIEKNALVLIDLINKVNERKISNNEIVVVGASMGGLVSRYALNLMEKENQNHDTRLFISFDSPQNGANIPLGVQYWLNFFSNINGTALDYKTKLSSEAAQQMLLKHYSSFPYPNELRTSLISRLSILGDYPNYLRKVAISNGKATGDRSDEYLNFSEGSKIIGWAYGEGEFDPLVIDGDCWASGTSMKQITEAYLDGVIVPSNYEIPSSVYDYVYVKTNMELDYAPGGLRNTQFEIAEVNAPYGDIVSFHDYHCFIPTISALGINTNDSFYNIIEDEFNLLNVNPFDSLYFPTYHENINQGHCSISNEMVDWIKNELIPDNLELENEKIWGQGNIIARKSIRLLPGYNVNNAKFMIKSE
ncbi:MAG TPA: hypothetical protein PLK90_09665 [Clostridiales bacterium]|nr:hypothetical protein [Clostridiales bacterium]HQP70652.1 hypothetical protein [Clostridiales bacterium]